MKKRNHALHELLSSERAYGSDLALIREVHIPLALGINLINVFLNNSSSTDQVKQSQIYQYHPPHHLEMSLQPQTLQQFLLQCHQKTLK